VKRFIRILSSVVRRVPRTVIVAAVVLTLVFGYFIQFQEQATGNEGFSPDSPEFLAAQTVDEVFTQSSQVAVQVLLTSEAGDVITADGLRTYAAVRRAVLDSRASEIMGVESGDPSEDVRGFLDPALGVLAGTDPAAWDDATVKAAQAEGVAALPPAVAEEFGALFSNQADLSVPESPSGLMVVFLSLSALEDDPDLSELQAIQVDMRDQIGEAVAATPGDDVSAEPFSFSLLFANQDEFQSEIGRLFAAAGYIIVIILASVFLIVPRRRSGVWLAGGGFALLALTTLLMVLEILPIFAPLLAIVIVFGLWTWRERGLRRAAADTGLALAVILMSISWMNGIGVLLGPKYLGLIGNFSEFLQIVPILLIGLGVDYAIHLISRYREELGSGSDVVTAATRASRTVGVALVLATVTTAVGFLTNIVSPVTAVKDFGILATVGIGSAFLLMLTFVPAVRILLDRRAERRGEHPISDVHDPGGRLLPRIMGSLSVFAERVPIVMLVIALGLGGAGAFGLTKLDTTFSFTDFVPEGSPMLETFDALAAEYGGGVGERTQVLIEGADLGTAEVHNSLGLSTLAMADTPDVATFGDRVAAESPLSVIFLLVTPPEQGGSPESYDPQFAERAAGLGLQPDLSVSAEADVDALYREAEAVAPEAMQRVIAEGADGRYRYINVTVSTTAGEQGAGELAENLREDFAPVSDIEGVTAVPTNENIISDGVVQALQSSQLSSLLLTIVAAMLLLVVNFLVESRRPFLGVITILPVALVVLWVFGAMAVTGISFNPVTAMIAAIAIGIGVPYTIHITHRYQEDRIRCDSPEEAIRSTMTHTGGALAGSALTTVAGFGILITSTLKPFQQFGLVVGFAIGFALIAAVLVLPSMLVLWDRWHRRRGEAVIDETALAGALTNGAPAS
jgi:predicted RND superfamily exporter protein